MKITFILPGSAGAPVGGVKVAYEYANHLAARGHQISVVHSPVPRIDPSRAMLAKAVVRYPQRLIDRSFRPDRWMMVDPRVRVSWTPSLAQRYVPDADAVIATAWSTAEWVAGYGKRKGTKFYLIQHYEIWDGSRERVDATWKAPLHKIVIARWLHEIATQFGQPAEYIPNGLDFGGFGMDVPIEKRPPYSAFMLFHNMKWKGSADGLAAARSVRETVPDFRLSLFGVPAAPENTPDWVTYHRNPPQALLRKLYNDAAVFIAPSLAEGWPLPPAEAMMSGLALACTDIGGHQEYAKQGETALLSPPGKPAALAQNILRLLEDKTRRVQLAVAGNRYIQQFTWARAVDNFERFVAQTVQAEAVTVATVSGLDRAQESGASKEGHGKP